MRAGAERIRPADGRANDQLISGNARSGGRVALLPRKEPRSRSTRRCVSSASRSTGSGSFDSEGENFERSRAIKRSVAVEASISLAGRVVLRACASFVGSLRATFARRGARAERAAVEGAVGAFAARVVLPAAGVEEADGASSKRGVVPGCADTDAPDAGMATFEPLSAGSADGAEAGEFDVDVLDDDAETGKSTAGVLGDDGEARTSDAGAFDDDTEARTSDAGALDDDGDSRTFDPRVVHDDAEAATSDGGVLDDEAEAGRSDANVLEPVDEPSFAFDRAEAVAGASVPLSTLTTRLSGAPSLPRST